MNGVSLFEHLCDEPRYSEATVCYYMRQLLKALQHLHHKKIIHLDLKVCLLLLRTYKRSRYHYLSFFYQPENLLLDTTANQLKLIDFGSAQEVELRGGGSTSPSGSSLASSSSSQDGVCSSPEFLSPEVISSGPVGTFTDMWGFGVLLYVALR